MIYLCPFGVLTSLFRKEGQEEDFIPVILAQARIHAPLFPEILRFAQNYKGEMLDSSFRWNDIL
jgi:hypothetical protein